MKKILIIGQAPPFNKQEVPYDSTMLYDWLNEVDITKEKAQEMFAFDAVYDRFPGYAEDNSHLAPSYYQMMEYYNRSLKDKIDGSDKLIILGNVAKEFLTELLPEDKQVLFLMHPSTRNRGIYFRNKTTIINGLKKFIEYGNN